MTEENVPVHPLMSLTGLAHPEAPAPGEPTVFDNLIEDVLDEPLIAEVVSQRQPSLDGKTVDIIIQQQSKEDLHFKVPATLPILVQQQFTELITKRIQCFSVSMFEVGCWIGPEFRIPLIENWQQYYKPHKLRKCPPHFADQVHTQFMTQLNRKIIRNSHSPFASAIVVVPRKDGTKPRPCGDYTNLNVVTIPDAYPLPLIDVILSFLIHCTCFITLDIRDGYHNIRVAEEDKPKTAIITPWGLFEWNRAPFGPRNVPACFQRAMNTLFADEIEEQICLVYLDDIIILGHDFQNLLNNCNRIL